MPVFHLVIFVIVHPTLVGISVLVALLAPLEIDQFTAIVGAVGIGTVAAIPVSIIVATTLRRKL